MKADSIAVGIAGVVFGLLAGWVIGAQRVPGLTPEPPAAVAAAPSTSAPAPPPAAPVDEAKANALKATASQEPRNPEPRVQLGNMYFDAERYQDAIAWYGEALKLSPKDVNISTDLGVSYWYTNQPDRALAQFDESLKIDSTHTKTLLNVGIVRAFGKQDLEGAQQAWQRVVQLAPESAEAKAAQRALDSLKNAHPPAGQPAAKPGA